MQYHTLTLFSPDSMCLGMCVYVRLYLFHVSCEGVIIAEPVTFSDIQTRTCALLWAFSVAAFLNQRGTFIGWPGINGTHHHMWDISLRIKKYFQLQIQKKKERKAQSLLGL